MRLCNVGPSAAHERSVDATSFWPMVEVLMRCTLLSTTVDFGFKLQSICIESVNLMECIYDCDLASKPVPAAYSVVGPYGLAGIMDDSSRSSKLSGFCRSMPLVTVGVQRVRLAFTLNGDVGYRSNSGRCARLKSLGS